MTDGTKRDATTAAATGRDDPLAAGLSFERWGDHRFVAWWFMVRPNLHMVLQTLLALACVLVAVFVRLPLLERWVVGVAGLALGATAAQYWHLALADSRSGAGRLSRRTYRWWIIGLGECFVGMVAVFVAAMIG